ncbi:MAG: flagellar motor switch protein FliN [Alphaproteobacteria bacterium]|nr:flagellar motor switch protein FliN [Alphaproteobacteria bacterium]
MAAEAAEAPEAGTAPDLEETSDQSSGGDAILQSGGEDGDENQRTATDLAAVYNIPVKVSAVLGRSTMQVSSLLKMGQGAVIELDRKVGEAIDIYVNNRLVARGEVVVVDERLGVTMTEIIKGDKA